MACLFKINKEIDLNLDFLFNVVISLQLCGANIEMDVSLTIVGLCREEIPGKLSYLLRPSCGPHQHLHTLSFVKMVVTLSCHNNLIEILFRLSSVK